MDEHGCFSDVFVLSVKISVHPCPKDRFWLLRNKPILQPISRLYAKIPPMQTKIIFMGTPDFALPTLRALAKTFTVVGAVTQPDRRAGRGKKLAPPPVKVLAGELEIPVFQPENINTSAALEHLTAWDADVMVVAAFGQILSPQVLTLPPHGCLNVHASLLPRWRGASPINAAILHGDAETGVTIMKMGKGLDSGPILSQRSIPIQAEDTAGSLFETLSQMGANLLVETIPPYLEGKLLPRPQDNAQTTYAPLLGKKDGELDFSLPAETLARRVRAFYPWPGTYTHWKGQRFKIHQAHAVGVTTPGVGVFTTYEDFPAIGAKDGLLVLDKVQPAGKRAMNGDIFLRGAKDW